MENKVIISLDIYNDLLNDKIRLSYKLQSIEKKAFERLDELLEIKIYKFTIGKLDEKEIEFYLKNQNQDIILEKFGISKDETNRLIDETFGIFDKNIIESKARQKILKYIIDRKLELQLLGEKNENRE